MMIADANAHTTGMEQLGSLTSRKGVEELTFFELPIGPQWGQGHHPVLLLIPQKQWHYYHIYMTLSVCTTQQHRQRRRGRRASG
jgi:hypothetical protein